LPFFLPQAGYAVKAPQPTLDDDRLNSWPERQRLSGRAATGVSDKSSPAPADGKHVSAEQLRGIVNVTDDKRGFIMPTAIETTTAIQDKAFAGLQVGQKAFLDSVTSWAETVETVFTKLPDLAAAPPAPPTELLENAFAFSQKVLASQRAFLTQVFEAAVPATRAPAAAASKAAPRG
jgi:hypothetical protein